MFVLPAHQETACLSHCAYTTGCIHIAWRRPQGCRAVHHQAASCPPWQAGAGQGGVAVAKRWVARLQSQHRWSVALRRCTAGDTRQACLSAIIAAAERSELRVCSTHKVAAAEGVVVSWVDARRLHTSMERVRPQAGATSSPGPTLGVDQPQVRRVAPQCSSSIRCSATARLSPQQ